MRWTKGLGTADWQAGAAPREHAHADAGAEEQAGAALGEHAHAGPGEPAGATPREHARDGAGEPAGDGAREVAGAAVREHAVPTLGDQPAPPQCGQPARAAGGLPAPAVRAMIELGTLGRTLWPAEVHRRWLEQASSAVADPAIPAVDRLALTVDRVTALLDLGEEEGWRAAAAFPVDAPQPAEAAEVARGCLNIGAAAMRWGRHEEARRRLSAALRLADRHHYPRLRELVLGTLAHLDWFTGPWAGLGPRADRLAGAADPRARLNAVLVAGHLDAADGMHRSAAQKLEIVLAQGGQLGARWLSCEAAAALARLRLADGQVAVARALTEEPVSVIAAKGIWLWATDLAPARVDALVAAGRAAEAAKLTAAFARGLRGHSAPAPRAALATCQAMLAEGHGKPGQAAGLFAAAGDVWAALPRPYTAALARERCGYCLIGAGQRDTGLAVLGEVFTELCALPARGDARRVMDALRDHGTEVWMPPRRLPEAGWWHANTAGSPGVRLPGGRARTWARGTQPPTAPARAAAADGNRPG